VNKTLQHAMFAARLTGEDVATRLEVDPKTVRRWLSGRLPHPRHRGELAKVLDMDESKLWPELLHGANAEASELAAVYPQRNAISSAGWLKLFESAEKQIDILAYCALFLAENRRLIDALVRKSNEGVLINVALGNPDGVHVKRRGEEEQIGESIVAKIRNALVLYRPLLGRPGVEFRLHDTMLYNSMYRADDQLLVNQHVFGIPAAQAPVVHLYRRNDGEMFGSYLESLARVWDAAEVLAERHQGRFDG
jgi:transcriptional regulator with XRE-family HTH domain